MNEKSPQWVTVTAEHAGRQVQGLYALDGEMLIVSYGIHSKARPLVGMAASTLARVLLLEFAKAGKPLYGATTPSLQASPQPELAPVLAS
jgi:hypothetical protein